MSPSPPSPATPALVQERTHTQARTHTQSLPARLMWHHIYCAVACVGFLTSCPSVTPVEDSIRARMNKRKHFVVRRSSSLLSLACRARRLEPGDTRVACFALKRCRRRLEGENQNHVNMSVILHSVKHLSKHIGYCAQVYG